MFVIFQVVAYLLSSFPVSYVLLPFFWIRSRASHNYFYETFIIIFIMPFWLYFYYFVVEVNTDSSAHPNNNTFSLENRRSNPKMIYNILCDSANSLRRTYNFFQPCPFTLY